MTLLSKRSTMRPAIREQALKCLNKTMASLTADDLVTLGNLICELSAQNLTDLTMEAFNASLMSFKNCKQLSSTQKAILSKRIISLYGNVTGWNSDTVMTLASLMTVFDESTISQLPDKKEIMDALQGVVDQMPPMSMSSMPDFDNTWNFSAIYNKIIKFNTVSKPRTTRAVPCSIIPTVEMIMNLKEGNCYLMPEVLACMTADTFSMTVDVLGAVRSFRDDQLAALKAKALEAWGSLSNITTDRLSSLGCIVSAFTESELQQLPLSSIDVLSTLSSFTWIPAKYTTVFNRFMTLTASKIILLSSVELVGLGNFICGMNSTQIQQLSDMAFRQALRNIGTVVCPSALMDELKKKCVTLLGPLKNWTHAFFQEAGNVIAGATADELKELPVGIMSFITNSAIPLIPPDRFKALTTSQLEAMSTTNSAMVTTQQMNMLTEEQKQALSRAAGTAYELPKVVVTPTKPAETGNVSPVKSGAVDKTGQGYFHMMVLLHSTLILLGLMS
ncbi:otoancorin-like [Protopterus annectens]|uniref:otoancorin-like n=1 Tax=Protopterus annectens TaxID=7888 RepID=UPI001CFB9F4C|nr:otoancorin-like [Protopterus annectens]